VQQIKLEEAQYVAHALADQLMSYGEPIPPFTTRYPGKLESCLAQPFQTVFGKPAYLRFTKRAAVLFYGVIKDHPFINGNKRMAVTLTLTFFFLNKRWLNIPPDVLYQIAQDVAMSKPNQRAQVIADLARLFNKSKELR
jgi:death-on-curing protein